MTHREIVIGLKIYLKWIYWSITQRIKYWQNNWNTISRRLSIQRMYKKEKLRSWDIISYGIWIRLLILTIATPCIYIGSQRKNNWSSRYLKRNTRLVYEKEKLWFWDITCIRIWSWDITSIRIWFWVLILTIAKNYICFYAQCFLRLSPFKRECAFGLKQARLFNRRIAQQFRSVFKHSMMLTSVVEPWLNTATRSKWWDYRTWELSSLTIALFSCNVITFPDFTTLVWHYQPTIV